MSAEILSFETGQPAERRREARQNRSRPHVDAFRLWCEGQLARVPAKGDLAKAMRKILSAAATKLKKKSLLQIVE